MRGSDQQRGEVFSCLSPESRVRRDHPLRAIRTMVDEVLRRYRPSLPHGCATGAAVECAGEAARGQMLQMLYSVRSERLLMEEIDYSIVFRWFIGLNLDEEVWDATTFIKNRDRLLEADVAKQFLAEVVELARARELVSDEHFSVDGTLLEAWASVNSYQRKEGKQSPPDNPGNPTVNFHGEKRSNQTHESKTDTAMRVSRAASGAYRNGWCGRQF
jgi:transposase